MSRRFAALAALVVVASLALLVLQLVRPDLRMTGAVLVPWLLLVVLVVVMAADAPPSNRGRRGPRGGAR